MQKNAAPTDAASQTPGDPSASPREPQAAPGKLDSPNPMVGDVAKEIQQLFRNARNRNRFLVDAFDLLCKHFGTRYGQLNAESKSDTSRHHWPQTTEHHQSWGAICDGLMLDVRYRQQAVAKWLELPQTKETHVAIACGISVLGEGDIGTMCLVMPDRDREIAHAELRELRALLSLVGQLVSSEQSAQNASTASQKPASSAEGAIKKASGYDSFSEFAYTFANSLTAKLGCEQVSLGWVHRQRVRLACVSGLDKVERGKPGIELIEQAMCEALDSNEIVSSQANAPDSGDSEHLLHRKWRKGSAATLTASIPLEHEGKVIAVIGIRDQRGQHLTPEQLQRVLEIASPLVPAMLLLKKADRGLLRHGAEKARDLWATSTRTRMLARAAMVLTVLLLATWMIVGKQTHHVVAGCSLEPAESFEVSAPFSGTLMSCMVEPGQRVKKGQLLLAFDTDPLESEQRALESQLEIAELQVLKALSESKVSLAAQADARAKSLKSQLRITRLKIDRAKLIAPCDGIVIHHQVEKRVGAVIALGEPLLEIGSSDHLRARLEVSENMVKYLNKGQRGRLTSTANPGQSFTCEIERIEVAATAQNGKNAIHVVTTVSETPPEWMRSGMQGVARIDTGRKPVWWVWLHGTIDTWRLRAWSL